MEFGSSLSCPIGLNSSLTKEEQALYQDHKIIQKVLKTCKTIAIVGMSTDMNKASFMVASYMKYAGYKVIPVNPNAKEILGEKCYPDLLSVAEPFDIVTVFRPIPECLAIAEQTLKCKVSAFWLQLKVINLEAAELTRKAGIMTVVDKCIKIEHGRYCGGLHEAGMNTEIITAKRARR